MSYEDDEAEYVAAAIYKAHTSSGRLESPSPMINAAVITIAAFDAIGEFRRKWARPAPERDAALED